MCPTLYFSIIVLNYAIIKVYYWVERWLSTCCFCREPGFSSLYSLIHNLQLSGHDALLMASLDIRHAHGTETHVGKTLIPIKFTHLKFFFFLSYVLDLVMCLSSGFISIVLTILVNKQYSSFSAENLKTNIKFLQ